MKSRLNKLPKVIPKDLKLYEIYYFRQSKELSTGRIKAKFKLLYARFDFGVHDLHVFLPLTSQRHVLSRDAGEIVTIHDENYEHVEDCFKSTLLGSDSSVINMNDIDPLKRNQVSAQSPCHYAARLKQDFCDSSTLRRMNNWREHKEVRTNLDYTKKQLASCTIKMKKGESTNKEIDSILTKIGL